MKVGIIGLGVVGKRTAINMMQHAQFEVVATWDLDQEIRDDAAKTVMGLPVVETVDELYAKDLDLIYIATPPKSHFHYVELALEKRYAIFCEKPLGIDISESEKLVGMVEASGIPAAVNFVFGSIPIAQEMTRRMDRQQGRGPQSIEINLNFSRWPRAWQQPATWLASAEEGGFGREVLSHFLFLTKRLVGPMSIQAACVVYPNSSESETVITALLDADGVPVTVSGGVGERPEQAELTAWGNKTSMRIEDWYLLSSHETAGWRRIFSHTEDPKEEAYFKQLDGLADMCMGLPHTMPSFREALDVQMLVEGILNHNITSRSAVHSSSELDQTAVRQA